MNDLPNYNARSQFEQLATLEEESGETRDAWVGAIALILIVSFSFLSGIWFALAYSK